MEPDSRDQYRQWWLRLTTFFIAAIAVQVVHLAIFGLDPMGFTRQYPWALGLNWVFFVIALVLFAALVACWVGMLRNSGRAPDHERRGLLVLTAFFFLSALERWGEGLPGVRITSSAIEIILFPLLLWYLARAVGEETQRDIDAKLGRGHSSPGEIGARQV